MRPAFCNRSHIFQGNASFTPVLPAGQGSRCPVCRALADPRRTQDVTDQEPDRKGDRTYRFTDTCPGQPDYHHRDRTLLVCRSGCKPSPSCNSIVYRWNRPGGSTDPGDALCLPGPSTGTDPSCEHPDTDLPTYRGSFRLCRYRG